MKKPKQSKVNWAPPRPPPKADTRAVALPMLRPDGSTFEVLFYGMDLLGFLKLPREDLITGLRGRYPNAVPDIEKAYGVTAHSRRPGNAIILGVE